MPTHADDIVEGFKDLPAEKAAEFRRVVEVVDKLIEDHNFRSDPTLCIIEGENGVMGYQPWMFPLLKEAYALTGWILIENTGKPKQFFILTKKHQEHQKALTENSRRLTKRNRRKKLWHIAFWCIALATLVTVVVVAIQ